MNNSFGTFRLIALSNNRRPVAFIFASLESLLFAYTASIVLFDIDNVANLSAYVLGFAVGGYVSSLIEDKLLNLYNIVDIIATDEIGDKIADVLRDEGHGVTEIYGEGARGAIRQLRIVAHHADVKHVVSCARDIQSNVFITVEESRFIRGGVVRKHSPHL